MLQKFELSAVYFILSTDQRQISKKVCGLGCVIHWTSHQLRRRLSLKRSVPRPPLALHPLQNIGRRPHALVHHGEQVAEHGPRRRRLPLLPVQEVLQVAVLRLLRELQI